MRFSRSSAFIVALAVPLSAATAPAVERSRGEPDPAGIAGVYLCEGSLPNGTTYTGGVEIVRHRDTVQLLWTLNSGEKYLGVGIVRGDVLAVTYFGEIPGLVLYEIVRDDVRLLLRGRWTAPHADGHVAGERLTRVGNTNGALHFKVVPHSTKLGRRKPSA